MSATGMAGMAVPGARRSKPAENVAPPAPVRGEEPGKDPYEGIDFHGKTADQVRDGIMRTVRKLPDTKHPHTSSIMAIAGLEVESGGLDILMDPAALFTNGFMVALEFAERYPEAAAAYLADIRACVEEKALETKGPEYVEGARRNSVKQSAMLNLTHEAIVAAKGE